MYSQEFIARIKEVYPNSPTMIELAEKGSDMLGRYLDDSSNNHLTPSDVLNSTYEELVEWAHREQEKRNLYHLYTTGACYERSGLEGRMCPILYMQNNMDNEKLEFENIICKDVGYVGYFPACKKWNCKQECWNKYYELKDSKR